jgi:protein transport protein SEC39
MSGLKYLSGDHCILLAAQYASESNLNSLRLLASSRQDVLSPELVLRTILTYLPETTYPSHYTELVDDVVHGGLSSQSTQLETDPIESWSAVKAHKRAKKLHLLPLALPSFPPSTCPEPLVQFLIHRAHRIEDQSGLLGLIPHLVNPFVDRHPFLRTWFISNVLPLLRLTFEYFPEDGPSFTLDQVECANSEEGMAIWLSYAIGHTENQDENGNVFAAKKVGSPNTLSRDLKGLVGPWMYGDNERKRRRLNGGSDLGGGSNTLDVEKSQELVTEDRHSWDQAFKRIIWMAKDRLPSVAEAIGNWDGPSDVDLGGYDDELHLSEDEENQLRERYAQTAFAAVYAAGANDQETVASAHIILERIGLLMDYEPVPHLQTGLDQLPRFQSSGVGAKELPNSILEAAALLHKDHILTSPAAENFALLQFCVLSAYILAELGSPLSVVNAAKLLFQLDKDEQLGFLQKVVHVLSAGSKRTETDWLDIRRKILWLRGWGQDESTLDINTGVFGKIGRPALEKELLKAFIFASCKSNRHSNLLIFTENLIPCRLFCGSKHLHQRQIN